MKNKILFVVVLIAIFIPSLVAVVSYRQVNAAPVSEKNVKTMELSDLAGETYTFRMGESPEETDMIRFFWEMNDDAVKINGLPTPLIGTNFFKVTMASARKAVDYQYYFSTDTSEAYYISGANTYRIGERYAAQFVSSKYAVSLYVNAVSPVLKVSGERDLLPKTSLWMYKNSAGMFVECESPTTTAVETVDLEGGLDLGFTIPPDSFAVKMTDKDSGAILFDDQYANISQFTLERSVSLDVAITAKWYETAERDYYGEMEYTFAAEIAAPAVFMLGMQKRPEVNQEWATVSSVQNGEFVVVTAKNVTDPTRVAFSSTPDIGYTPTFYRVGDYAVALVPMRLELSAGKYDRTFRYGGVTRTLSVNVTQRPQRTFDYTIAASVVSATRTDKTIADFKAVTQEAVMSGSDVQMWEGDFGHPVVMNGKKTGFVTTGFGYTRTIKATGVSYTHEGVDYYATEGSSVFALNSGKVVFAELTELGGNTIIIEHGFGLKSWYCHLSELTVHAGDTVSKGQTIGIVGQTGFTNQPGVHEGLSVFDVPVCPYPVQDDEGIKIVYPE